MRIVCDRQKLSEAFSRAALFADRRGLEEHTRDVRVSAGDSGVFLEAINQQGSCRVEFDSATVEGDGAAMLPPDRTAAILKAIRGSSVCIESAQGRTVIKGERSEFKVAAADGKKFPKLEPGDWSRCHVVQSAALKACLSRVGYAVDENSSRYALGGVLLEFKPDSLIAAASDSRRLAKSEIGARSEGDHSPSGDILPAWSCLSRVVRAMPDSGEARITSRDNDVLISAGGSEFTCRMYAGRFPRWRDLFPARRESTSVRAGDLLDITQQMALLRGTEEIDADGKTEVIKLTGVDYSFSTVKLQATYSAREGECSAEAAIVYGLDPVTVRLAYPFILDFLRQIDSNEMIEVETGDGSDAFVMRADERKTEYIIMPMTRDR